MITISLCMIVKNEERILKRCLDSVRDLVDEIIIVDPRMPQSGLQPDTPIKYMISHGTMISVRREILHFPKLRRNIFTPQMRMRCFRKRTGEGSDC